MLYLVKRRDHMSYYYLLIPLGIVLLVLAIKLGMLLFKQPIIFDSEKASTFVITKAGIYNIWIQAPLYKLNNLNRVRPAIIKLSSGEELTLIHSLFKTHKNGFTHGKLHIFSFYGEVGDYLFEEVAGSSLNIAEQFINDNFITNQTNRAPVSFFIQKKAPFWIMPLFFLSIFVGSMLVIFGLVFGLVM